MTTKPLECVLANRKYPSEFDVAPTSNIYSDVKVNTQRSN